MNGGYDDGYQECPCFWGLEAGSLVQSFLQRHSVEGFEILDLGCGEGKNAAAFARAGGLVTAIDCSSLAIENGKRAFPKLSIDWQVGDAINILQDINKFDVVVMYGLAHCLDTKAAIENLIKLAISQTKTGGFHMLVAFNNRSQDLAKAHPGFSPTLISHSDYLNSYSDHEIQTESDTILEETHPHNGIAHHHSLTRIEVRIR